MQALKVRATATGYHGLSRKKPGEVFEIADPVEFSHRWMEAVGWNPPDPKDGKKPAPPPETPRSSGPREPVAMSTLGKRTAPPQTTP